MHTQLDEALNSSPGQTTIQTRLAAHCESCRATTCSVLFRGDLGLKLSQAVTAELGRGVRLGQYLIHRQIHLPADSSASSSSTRPVAWGVLLSSGALQSGFWRPAATRVHLHQSLAPPELCHKQLCLCGAALCSHLVPSPGQQDSPWVQWNWASLLPPQPKCCRTSPWPHSNPVIGGRGSDVSDRSFPRFGCLFTEPGSDLQHCFPQGRAVAGLEPCWRAESPPVTHP